MVSLLISARWALSEVAFLAVAVAVAMIIPPAGTVGSPQGGDSLIFLQLKLFAWGNSWHWTQLWRVL
jgi:hypothetical protein